MSTYSERKAEDEAMRAMDKLSYAANKGDVAARVRTTTGGWRWILLGNWDKKAIAGYTMIGKRLAYGVYEISLEKSGNS